MTRGPVASAGEAERAVRRRWAERNVSARILTPDDPGAPPYVLHCAPRPRSVADGDAGTVPAHVVRDVVARHRAMCDAAVTIVAAADDAQDGTRPSLGERLACLPIGEHYRTTDPAYLDSVRWALAQLWEAGLLYEAPHRFAWCAGCAAVADDLGAGEVDSEHTSAVVRFPVVGDNPLQHVGASLLVDVAEPWTVPAATAVRIDPETTYVLAQAASDDYPVVLARRAVPTTLGTSATVHRDVASAELLATRFRPPSAVLDPTAPLSGAPVVADARAAAVTGTGLVAVTPACTIDDWRIAADHGLPVVDVIGADGRLTAAAGAYEGVAVGDADHVIVGDLKARGLMVRIDHHVRPTGSCARCRHPVVVRARPAWLVATTRVRDRLRTERAAIAGLPAAAVRPWAAGDDDWPVARPGSGGLGLPLWRGARCGRTAAIDGCGTSCARTTHPCGVGARGARAADHDVARPGCTDGAARCERYVVDPLVVAAALPFARFGFPAEPGSDTDVARHARAQLLVDAAAPAGLWADAVIALSVLLWDAAGHDAALRVDQVPEAATDPDAAHGPTVSDLIDRHGGDAVRLAALTEPCGWRVGTQRQALAASAGRTLDGLRDACAALPATAQDGPSTRTAAAPEVDRRDVLDRWILAELSDTVSHVRRLLVRHDVVAAGRRLRRFITHLTHWYLPQRRRARARASDDTSQPEPVATATTHECLVTVAALLAPFAPVISDALYEALVRGRDPAAPDSVHLLRYPTADPTARNEAVREAMAAARRIAALGRHARRAAGIDPDRPLPRAAVRVTTRIAPYWDALTPLLADALSVKRLEPRQPDGEEPGDLPIRQAWHTVRDGEFVVALAVPVGPTVSGEPLPLGDVPIRMTVREVATR